MIQAVSLDTAPFRDAPALQARLRDSRRAFHQDVTCLGIGGDACGAMRVPVDPAMLESGVMQYARDSRHAMEH